MKSFFKKAWIGPLVLLCYALAISLFITRQITPKIKEEAFPVIIQEANNFLPITIQNGEVIYPENKLIHKSYSEGDETFHVVLDTRTEKLDINTLPQNGIYMSKKCIYVVSSDESKVRCLEPKLFDKPLVIDEVMFKNLINKIGKYMGTFLTCFLMVFSFIGFYLIILFYTIVMHWINTLFFKTNFGQTLFVNTLAYILMNVLEFFTPINISFWLKIITFTAINLIICKAVNDPKKR